MRPDARTIDVGVREAVLLLNRIPGVTTRASCQGTGRGRPAHRHADLAYVLFQFPLPLRLQEFLGARIAALARIEDDGIYARWPAHNRAFLQALAAAAGAYVGQPAGQRDDSVTWPLPKLRARLARVLSHKHAATVAFCRACRDLTIEPHASSHPSLPLLHLGPDREAAWFAEFAGHPANALDPALVGREGWAPLIVRALRGDFGAAFHRRWLKYRARRLTELGTVHIRSAIRDARRQGSDVEFFYDSSHAVLAWPRQD